MIYVTSWDGLALADAGPYAVLQLLADIQPFEAGIALRNRLGRWPTYESSTPGGRSIRLTIRNVNQTTNIFRKAIFEAFAPDKGERVLYATDSVTASPYHTLYLRANVANVSLTQSMALITVELRAADPVWRTTTTTTDAASPITNAGQHKALPTITITSTGGVVKRRTATITDTTGRGLSNHLALLTFDSTGAGATAAANYDARYKGLQIPFYVLLPNTATTTVAVRVDVPANGTTEVDLFYGSGFFNGNTAQRFDWGPVEQTSTNALIIWGETWEVSTAPSGADYTWTPAKVGQNLSGVSYQLDSESVANVVFKLAPNDTLRNDADGLVCVLGATAAGGSLFTNLTRVLAGFTAPTNAVQTITVSTFGSTGGFSLRRGETGATSFSVPLNATAGQVQAAAEMLYGVGNVTVGVAGSDPYTWTLTYGGTLANQLVDQVQAPSGYIYGSGGAFDPYATWAETTVGVAPTVRGFVRYAKAGQAGWTDAWTSTIPGTYTGSGGAGDAILDIPAAVRIAVGIEPLTEAATGTLTLSGAAQVTLAANLSVSMGAAATAHATSGSLANTTTGDSLVVSSDYLLWGDTTLVVNCYDQTIYTTDGSRYYGDLIPSRPNEILPLTPGANVVSNLANTSSSWAWADRILW